MNARSYIILSIGVLNVSFGKKTLISFISLCNLQESLVNGKGVHFGDTTEIMHNNNNMATLPGGGEPYPTANQPPSPSSMSPVLMATMGNVPEANSFTPSSSVPKGTYVTNVMVGEEIDDRKYEMKVTDEEVEEDEEPKEFCKWIYKL